MKAAAQAMVLSSSPGSGTCSKGGLGAALAFARQSSALRRLIIHLSDGIQTCPGFEQSRYGEECIEEVTLANSGLARINTICIGPAGAVDEEWMRRLALLNRGSYVRLQE